MNITDYRKAFLHKKTENHKEILNFESNQQNPIKLSTKTEININICIIGAANVGKTSLLCKYINKINVMQTIFIDLEVKYIQYKSQNYRISFVDFCGGERFQKNNEKHYKEADGIMLVYDVNDKNSFSYFNELKHIWLSNKNCKLSLIANKVDLERVIQRKSGELLAKDYGAEYHETSKDTNVSSVFESLIFKIIEDENIISKKQNKMKSIINKRNSDCFKCCI